MRTIDLFINYVPCIDSTHPWAVEKNRTFSCKCGHGWTIPETAIDYLGGGGDESMFRIDKKHFDGRCPACGCANYELQSFIKRYELVPVEPVHRKKRSSAGQRVFSFME